MLLAKVHLSRECAVRLPLAARARRGLLEHLIDLFERETLGLGHKEVGKQERDAAETAPHEEDVGAETSGVSAVGDQVWRDDAL